jgi:hypothetical protein
MSTLTYGPRAVYPTQLATRDLEQGEKAHPTAQRIDRTNDRASIEVQRRLTQRRAKVKT